MSTRKTTLFYALLISVASLAVGMVIASRLDLTPTSSAQTIGLPPMNSAPLTGPLDRYRIEPGRRRARILQAAAGRGKPGDDGIPYLSRHRSPGGGAPSSL